MQEYNLSGLYQEGSKRGHLEGRLQVSANGTILQGPIEDKDSPEPHRHASAKIQQTKAEIKLELIVEVPGDTILNFLYEMKKKNDGSLSGTYKGTWKPVDKILKLEGGVDEEACGKCMSCGAEISDLTGGGMPVKEYLAVKDKDNRKQYGEITLTKVKQK